MNDHKFVLTMVATIPAMVADYLAGANINADLL